MKKILTILALTLSVYALQTGEVPPHAVLSGDHGGTNDGKSWDSRSLVGKVHTVLYMDPDERKAAMPFLDALNAQPFDKQKYQTVAIVNLAATWMPDAILETMLAKQQKSLNNTIFVFDKTKYLLQKWHLKDDASNVLIFDAKGKLVYQKSGVLSADEIRQVMQIISKHLQ
ncbi:MAG: YtfJ family protein [Sulfurovum sp.]|nr:YtfJ family protein [Sulfurovum sp.]